MKQQSRDLARAVLDLAEQATPADVELLLAAAVDYLSAHGLTSDIKMFPRVLEREWHKRENSVSALLATPSGDAGAYAQRLSETLESLLKKKIDVIEEKDANLLGGARLSYGDERFDRSIRSALDLFTDHVRAASPV